MIRSPFVILAALAASTAPSVAQHPERILAAVEGQEFRVYGPAGESMVLDDVVAALDAADAALVGEFHTDDVGHRVEKELLIRTAQRYGITAGEAGATRRLVVSLEFFERDVQLVLDEYLRGFVTEDQFLAVARPWENYASDYRPLVEFARAHAIPVVAANAPRRYVNRVTRYGPQALDSLPAGAYAFLPPLPYPGPSEAYMAQFMAEMEEGMGDRDGEQGADPHPEDAPTDRTGRTAPADHGMGFAMQSQALWDATMSYAIAGALDRIPGALVIHYVGGFHVAHHTGIPEKVPYYRPGTHLVTISIEPVEDISAWNPDDHEGLADFVILTQAPPEREHGKERLP